MIQLLIQVEFSNSIPYTYEPHYQRQMVAKYAQVRERTDESRRYCTLELSNLRRWGLVSRAWQKHRPRPEEYDHLDRTRRPKLRDAVCDRMRNWPAPTKDESYLSGLHGQDDGIQLLIFTIASGPYGGLHLPAWNATFAASWQQSLWCALLLSHPQGFS